MAAEPTTLSLLSETKLDPPPHSGLLTHNPSIELFAHAAGSKTLEIWRSNGQTVTKSSQRGEKESVQALRWKADGKYLSHVLREHYRLSVVALFHNGAAECEIINHTSETYTDKRYYSCHTGEFLAVGWSDGVVRLMGLENSKAVHQIPVCEAGKADITCIGWARNYAGRRSVRRKENDSSWEDLSLDGLNVSEKGSTVDLSKELTFLEVETSLPKLSPLPASGGSGDDMYVFTTRASLEFLFRPFSPETSDLVDVMLVGTDKGQIHLSIYDSFIIGNFQYSLPSDLGAATRLKLTHLASHPEISTYSLLFQPTSDSGEGTKKLYLVPMDLTFIHSSPENLSLLASKTTTLQKLLRYVKQVQTHMVYEWQSTRELPGKFLNSINETLREAENYGEMDIGQAMYHSVVTGHTFPEVKEWLVDQLAERGHKRWDKAVVSGLENLRSLVHENFLPALERIAIILSRLLGIARFHESKDEIGFTSLQITKVMDTVSCLMLVGNKILLLVMEELELFHSFSSWLRYEIDHLASSSVSDELTEKEATMEHAKILTYIQQYMPASPLRFYLGEVSKDDLTRDSRLAEVTSSLLNVLDKQIKKQEDGKPGTAVFPQVEFLGEILLNKANVVFEGIAEAEKRNVRFGQATALELQNVSKIDVRMHATDVGDALKGTTYIALTEEHQGNSIHLFRAETSIINGISGNVATQHSCLTLEGAKILDIKFVYENTLLALISIQDQFRLIRIPHQSAELGYQDYVPGASTTSHVLSAEQVVSVFPNMLLPGENGFLPVQMEVKEASTERGKITARVCLLGDSLKVYKVFALPDELL